ncbi:MAG: ethanolamine ammonia lyase large subunit [Leptospiraceae bacterium]|nr:ethanolamine ammonia lyase large subunit [Leptospiraceae bacterium]
MQRSIRLGNDSYTYPDLKTLMARATPARSGDELAGVAAQEAEERVAAQLLLAEMPLAAFLTEPIIPPETDNVSALIFEDHEPEAFTSVQNLSVGEFREWLLSDSTTDSDLTSVSRGLMPEMVAAVSKIMRIQDMILVSKKCHVKTAFRTTIGLPGTLSVRLQPNHPTDDEKGILASTLDGLMYGCGDAVVGINPATDNLPTVTRLLELLDQFRQTYSIPFQSCILTHVTSTMDAMAQGAPVDLVFQSIGGTEAVNKSFGVELSMLQDAYQMSLELNRGTIGHNTMYFETGQGSALSASAHEGVDQQTLEARAYGVARRYNPLLVNTVVGFIGPEYLFDAKQIIRAGIEDHFCGKLLGLPMGVDVCYTNHAEADQDDMDILLTLLGNAGVTFIMGVPGADDIMLNYQSTSFHDALYIRKLLGLKPAPEFQQWLESIGLDSEGNPRAKANLPEFFGAIQEMPK